LSKLKTIRITASANLKLALVLLAFLIVGGTLLYTQRLVVRLKASERKTLQHYVATIQSAMEPDAPPELLGLAFDLIGSVDFPMIQTDAQLRLSKTTDPTTGRFVRFESKNVDYDTTANAATQEKELLDRLERMKATYDPIPVYLIDPTGDSTVINYYFYDDSQVIRQLQWLPYIEILIGSMFIFVGYLSFSHIKRNEQSNIWVGMAKETAHQLGTPLSSLLGWIELLRMMPEDTRQVLEAADEMERDVERLNKVAQRFSKIGSAAEVQTVDINDVVRRVAGYFERRLPHLGKRVTLSVESTGPVYVSINVHLFEWVFENLVRNAADAIDRPDGHVTFRVREQRDSAVIDVIDNGRGIDPKIRKDIFRPGFSTKKRGWGLGLSLAKRIVEEYHKGRISIKESSPEGTTFRIRLATVPAPALPAPDATSGDVARLETRSAE
jgi:C4-dicarboxylate-specific signal transduction histidine kinase